MQDLSFSFSDIWIALLRDLQAIWRQSSSTVLVALAIASIVLIVSAIVCRILPQQRQHIALGAGVAFVGSVYWFSDRACNGKFPYRRRR